MAGTSGIATDSVATLDDIDDFMHSFFEKLSKGVAHRFVVLVIGQFPITGFGQWSVNIADLVFIKTSFSDGIVVLVLMIFT